MLNVLMIIFNFVYYFIYFLSFIGYFYYNGGTGQTLSFS